MTRINNHSTHKYAQYMNIHQHCQPMLQHTQVPATVDEQYLYRTRYKKHMYLMLDRKVMPKKHYCNICLYLQILYEITDN